MTMLYLQDHDERSNAPVVDVAGLLGIGTEKLKNSLPIASEIIVASHGIVHVDDDELGELINEWRQSGHGDLLLLRVSEGDKLGLAEIPHHQESIRGEAGFRSLLVLNARNDSVLDGDVVVHFANLSVAEAEDVCRGDLTGLVPPLQRLFSKAFTPFAVALDILCQGYEVAHRVIPGLAMGLTDEQISNTESIQWWMKCLGLPRLEELGRCLKAERVRVDLIDKIEEGFRRMRSAETVEDGVSRVRDAVKEALA